MSLFICSKNENNLFNLLENVKNDTVQTSSCNIAGHLYQTNILLEDVEIIFRLIRRGWIYIQNTVLSNNLIPIEELYNARKDINEAFEALIKCLCLNKQSSLKSKYFNDAINYLHQLNPAIIPFQKLGEEVLMKIPASLSNSKSPYYEYFHSALEMHSYFLLINLICKTNILETIERVMDNLITIAFTCFKRGVLFCACEKHLWKLILFLCKTEESITFWEILEKLLKGKTPMFSLSLIAKLDDIKLKEYKAELDPNFGFIERQLKNLLLEADSSTLLNCFKLIKPLVCNRWLKSGRIEIYQICWDYFSKRLNISILNNNTTPLELVEIIDSIRNGIDCNEDFNFFLGMLVIHLKEHPNHWMKIKGRIYSQLGPNKVKDLNNTGIIHVVTLFLALASVNFEEMLKKVLGFLESLPEEKKKSLFILGIYTSIIMQLVKEEKSIEKAADPLLRLLQETSCDPQSFKLIKEFVNNFQQIINLSNNFELAQSKLINSWLSKYLLSCSIVDLKATLNLISIIKSKVENVDIWPHWQPVFKEHIYPSLKQIAGSSNAPSFIGKLVAEISLLTSALTNEAFTFFTSEATSLSVTSQFLLVILQNYPDNYILSPQQETVILQCWIKINLVCPDSDLNKSIGKLDIFPKCLEQELNQDAFVSFVKYLGLPQNRLNSSIMKLVNDCFGQLDQCLQQYLTQTEPTVLRMFTCIALSFLHCGHLLYNRNRSSCPLIKLVSAFLLPNDFMIGKQPNCLILEAVKKTWHLFYQALIKLNINSDPFLERTLRDLVCKYLPYFSTGDSPIIKALGVDSSASVILDKISSVYFKHPCKEPDLNVQKALMIINEFVQSTTSVDLLGIVVDKCLFGLCEVVIFHSLRNNAIGVIKMICSSELYFNIREDFKAILEKVTEKHIAFNTMNYFQLMLVLGKFVPADVKALVPCIKKQICNVERLRGVGFDKTLRQHLEKLENCLFKT